MYKKSLSVILIMILSIFCISYITNAAVKQNQQIPKINTSEKNKIKLKQSIRANAGLSGVQGSLLPPKQKMVLAIAKKNNFNTKQKSQLLQLSESFYKKNDTGIKGKSNSNAEIKESYGRTEINNHIFEINSKGNRESRQKNIRCRTKVLGIV